jgi:enoyl-CoA hydratase/carnithine racemase
VAKSAPPEELMSVGHAYAAGIALVSRLGVRLTKKALTFALATPGLEAVIAMEDRNQAFGSGAENYVEAIRSVLEKRYPVCVQPEAKGA